MGRGVVAREGTPREDVVRGGVVRVNPDAENAGVPEAVALALPVPAAVSRLDDPRGDAVVLPTGVDDVRRRSEAAGPSEGSGLPHRQRPLSSIVIGVKDVVRTNTIPNSCW